MTRIRGVKPVARVASELLDGTIALIALLLTSPLALLIAIAIKADSSGPVIFKATRVGVNGRLFTMLKFRTMRTEGPSEAPAITAMNDPRITRVGGWLRASKLDEWPQLVNVIRGDMSLVGPRPEDPRYVASYTEEQRQLLRVRPGITSVASLAFRDEARLLAGPDWERCYRQEILPAKLGIELGCLDRMSPIDKLVVLWRTAASCVFRRDTNPESGSRRSRMLRKGARR